MILCTLIRPVEVVSLIKILNKEFNLISKTFHFSVTFEFSSAVNSDGPSIREQAIEWKKVKVSFYLSLFLRIEYYAKSDVETIGKYIILVIFFRFFIDSILNDYSINQIQEIFALFWILKDTQISYEKNEKLFFFTFKFTVLWLAELFCKNNNSLFQISYFGLAILLWKYN